MQQSNAKLNQAGAILKLWFLKLIGNHDKIILWNKNFVPEENKEKRQFSCFHCCHRVVKYRALPLGNELFALSQCLSGTKLLSKATTTGLCTTKSLPFCDKTIFIYCMRPESSVCIKCAEPLKHQSRRLTSPTFRIFLSVIFLTFLQY